jgi:uncharacterized protein with NRDE domain
MCLALLALDAHPRYPVVVIANRDEYHARPTAPARWWPQQFVAGRDLAAGGTWLGVSRSGRFALLTNVRDPSRHDPSAPSRGSLVPDVLADPGPIVDVLERARRDGARHNGFNLLAGAPGEAAWTSNRAERVLSLAPGLYGLSNAQLDVPWPKLSRTKAALARWVAQAGEDAAPLFDALADTALAPDAELPATGVALEWERRLSAPFIVSERYGTRSSTIVTIDRGGEVRFVERSFDVAGATTGEVEHRFVVDTFSLSTSAG